MPIFEGFDFARPQNIQKSAKDAFADLAKRAPVAPPIQDKSALGAWFSQYIAPGMNSLGHRVLSNAGDSFRFQNHQGLFDVDFGRGAGAAGGALQWGATDPNAPPPVLGQGRPGVSETFSSPVPSALAPAEDLPWMTPSHDWNPFQERYSVARMLGGRNVTR